MRKFDYAIDDNFSFKSWQGVLTESMLREADESAAQSGADNAEMQAKVDELQNISNYEKFVDTLDADRKDPKFVDFLNTYYADKSVFDAVVPNCKPVETSIAIKNLIPTQNEIDLEKSLCSALGTDKYWKPTIDSSVAGKDVKLGSRLIVYAGKYIIDGHHRWSKVYTINPEATMQVYDFPANEKLTVTDILKAMQASIVASGTEFELKNVDGLNMLTTDASGLKTYIKNNMTKPPVKEKYEINKAYAKNAIVLYEDTAYQLKNAIDANANTDWEAFLKVTEATSKIPADSDRYALSHYLDIKYAKNAEAVYDKLVSNISTMQKNCKPIQGAAKRKFMPQTSEDSIALTHADGLIDFTP